VNSVARKVDIGFLKGRSTPWNKSNLTSVNPYINLSLKDINFKMASLILKTIAVWN
jgi:hypothetical protein